MEILMMQRWYEDMVRFMKDASEYGNYNQELAQMMEYSLNKNMHICDAGCGLGYLSLALAPMVKQVTSVEMNDDAIRVLEDNCSRFGVHNIETRCGEIEFLKPEEKYDAMVFCFFGHIHEILKTAKEQCKGTVLIATRNYSTHRFSVGTHNTGSYGYKSTREVLKEKGIPFEYQTFELEFGQPFRSMEDARLFFELYSNDEDKGAITEEFLRSKVIQTGDETFPLYMPHRRKLALVRFQAEDIKEE